MLLDKTKKSTDNEIRQVAAQMESIEKFNGDNKFHMIGKSEIDIEQIISVAKMFDQYN